MGLPSGVFAREPSAGRGVVAILGRNRLPSEVIAELVEALADEPPLVVCDLDGIAAGGAALRHAFDPVTEYLRVWPGPVVAVIAREPSLRRQVMSAAHDRLLVRGSLIEGVADAQAVMAPVRRRELRLTPRPADVYDARTFVTGTLTGWGLAEVVGAAVLVVSELVSNAVLHAATVLDVTVSAVHGRVRVAVHDDGGGAPRAAADRPEEDVGGRGLHLAQAVSRGWGVLPGRLGGKTVWAVLEQPPASAGTGLRSQTASPPWSSPVAAGPQQWLRGGSGEEVDSMLPGDWARLVALLDGRPDADPMTRVQRLCEVCTQATAVSGVALGIATNGQRSTVCATNDLSAMLEELQTTVSEGPSIEAYRDGWPVLAPHMDAADEDRWPWFRSLAVEAGVRAMFALPLRVAAIRLGAMTLHRVTPGQLDPSHTKDAKTLAEAASILLSLNQPGESTAGAFLWVVSDRSRFRPEVYQAVGRTMVQLGVDARDAFARICAYAYAEGRPIGQVADDIMSKRLRLPADGA